MTADSDQPRGPRRPRAPERAPQRAPERGGESRTPDPEQAPRYTRYRAGPRLRPRREKELGLPPAQAGARRTGIGTGRGRVDREAGRSSSRRRPTRKRLALGLIALVLGWLTLSLVLFLASSAFRRTSPRGNVSSALDSGGSLPTSASNILVLGSDRRQKNSREPGANTSGPSRSDSIMLIRTGGGHAARLSIPRDTVVEIPGHGLQKINAAYAFGGPTLAISTIKRYLGIPINHLVEVNFEDFPQLIDAMGGVDYTGGCVVSRIDGGFSNGGYTLRLAKGTHRLNGKQALALARTRENVCSPNETDLQRAEHQQALFQDMKSRLLSPSSFLRLPWIAWNAPPALVSDMSGPTLIALFAALAVSGTPPTHLLKPSGAVTLPGGGAGLSVSDAERRAAVARFMGG